MLNINKGWPSSGTQPSGCPVRRMTTPRTARSAWLTCPLSELGEQVMLALLQLGLTDEEVEVRMSVSPNGVGARRRKWGRAYG